jgi:hypothetical protein
MNAKKAVVISSRYSISFNCEKFVLPIFVQIDAINPARLI